MANTTQHTQPSAYADVDVIVAGALDSHDVFTDETLLNERIAEIEQDAEADGYRTEVFIVWHEHSPDIEDCSCVQYLTDHHPQYVFQPDGAS